MTIELTEKTIGIWAIEFPQEDKQDWLCSAWETDDEYIALYRFRYYIDDLTFDSMDKKSWYRIRVSKKNGSREKFILTIQGMVEMLWKLSGGRRYELLMDDYNSVPRIMEEMLKWPFMTSKEITKEEVE